MRYHACGLIKKSLLVYLSACVFVMGFWSTEGAALLVPSAMHEDMKASAEDPGGDLRKIQAFLETRLVGQRLSDLGFGVQEVQMRLSDLSEDEIHEIARNLDGLQTGGDSALGILIALLVIVILVFILLQITGHKVIVTK